MHASVSRYRVMDVEALVKRVQEEFVERVKTIEGFVGYYVIDGGDGTVTSITLAETEERSKPRPCRRNIGSWRRPRTSSRGPPT